MKSTEEIKSGRLQIRIRQSDKEAFEKLCYEGGTTVSGEVEKWILRRLAKPKKGKKGVKNKKA